MSKPKKAIEVKQSFKKDLKKKIAFQLTNNLEELKTMLGDKKFNTRIRKASKLLSSGIKKSKVDTSAGGQVSAITESSPKQ